MNRNKKINYNLYTIYSAKINAGCEQTVRNYLHVDVGVIKTLIYGSEVNEALHWSINW